jgi:hypothetical protein
VAGKSKPSGGAILVLLAAVLGIYLATLRTGERWGDDFAYYLHHARNLIEGRAYADTGLIENPRVLNLGPRYYSPGFPALIAPVLAVFGFNYTALKIEVLLVFALGLWFIYALFRNRLTQCQALSAVAVIGFNPVIWGMRDDLVSDLPFLTALYGTLLLFNWLDERYFGKPPAAWGIVAGAGIYVAYAIRQPGLALIPALVCFDAARLRRVRPFTMVAVVSAGAAMVGQRLILGSDGRTGLFDFTPRWLASSVTQNVRTSAEFWSNAWAPAMGKVVFLAALALMAWGLWRALSMGTRLYDWAALFYSLLILAYPFISIRYLLPVFPVLVAYMVLGFEGVFQWPRGARRTMAAAAALAIVLACYCSEYATAASGPIREGVSDPEFVAMCAYARGNTPPDSRFVVRKPRVFTLLADRAAAVYSVNDSPEALMAFLRSIHAQYLVQGDPPAADFDPDSIVLGPFLETYRDRMTLIYQNAHYRLYRVE